MQQKSRIVVQTHSKTHNLIIGLVVLFFVTLSTASFSKTNNEVRTNFENSSSTEEYSDSDALGAYGDENDEYVADEEDTKLYSQRPKETDATKTGHKGVDLSVNSQLWDEVDVEVTQPGYGSKLQDDDA